MEVIYSNNYKKNIAKPAAIALGTFDGVHMGHQKLIEELMKVKKVTACPTMVYTFYNHPLLQIAPERAPALLMDLSEKINMFNRLGIDYLVLNEFDESFLKIPARDFVKECLVQRYPVNTLVVGYNFRFGYQGLGDVKLLKSMGDEYGFNLIVVPPVKISGQIVSSSMIRALIEDGKVERVARYLGYFYALSGVVVRGYGRGRIIGFPTANLNYNTRKAIPKCGVYLTKNTFKGENFWGVTNVGSNPTFHMEGMHIETHFINFNQNLYHERISLEFIKRIRDEHAYPNMDELRKQISHDVDYAKNFIYKYVRV